MSNKNHLKLLLLQKIKEKYFKYISFLSSNSCLIFLFISIFILRLIICYIYQFFSFFLFVFSIFLLSIHTPQKNLSVPLSLLKNKCDNVVTMKSLFSMTMIGIVSRDIEFHPKKYLFYTHGDFFRDVQISPYEEELVKN